jgi:hypothetical protein
MERDNLLFDFEVKNLTKNSKEIIEELNRFSYFLKSYSLTTKDLSNLLKEKLKIPENHPSRLHESILLTNIIGIYDSFQSYLLNIDNFMSNMQTDIIDPFDNFSNSQLKAYNDFLEKVKDINIRQKNCKNTLEKAKINYYKEAYYTKEDIESNDFKEHIFNGEKNLESLDILLKNKMRVKIYESIYNYEIFRYNKNIVSLNKEYNIAIEQLKMAEKTRIKFIKASIDKYKIYWEKYIKNINDYLYIIENFVSQNVCEKDEKFWMNEITRYKKNDSDRIPQEQFLSFKEYMEKNRENVKNNKDLFKYDKNKIITLNKFDEKEEKNFINNIIDDLIKEDEIALDKIASLIELFNNKKKNTKKIFLDSIIDKKKTSIKFFNLKNLEHLSNIFSCISLKEDSIFKGNFELNFKIIYIAERIYYQNKSNNKKTYLSAILSKNKYFRTKQFWRNVIELKLAHKLNDHIERLRNITLPEETKKNIFGKLGEAMGKNNINQHKFSLLSKSRILPLIKYYNEIEPSKISFIDKMATQEMFTIIKESIQSSSNFNFSTETCLDLVAKLTEEYKISKDNIKFFVLYTNICSCTVRKRLPNDRKVNNDMFTSLKNVDEKLKKIKLLEYTIPYLTNVDLCNLLLCSKLYNKKLKKKIFSHVLSQENMTKKMRLNIWKILLDIPNIKKKLNYREILKNADDEKTKEVILLDVVRTNFNYNKNPDEAKEQLTNVLYAASIVNNGIKYCQGMNFFVEFLLTVFDEEEAFYIFISLFENTEYSLIFTKDLHKLKVFFYIFKRIISLYEPELSSHLNSSGIDFSYFLPPWFITLFAGSHQHHNTENDDNSNLLLRILDNFILYGWKSMMELCCVILHLYESYLMNLKYDGMMHFLINEITKSDFFGPKNIKLIEISLDFKIKKKLVKNIEAEYLQNLKVKETMD